MNSGILDANSSKIKLLPKESTRKVNLAMAVKLVFYWNHTPRTFLSQHFKTTSELGLRKAFIKAPIAEYFICNCSSASSCPTWGSSRVFVPSGHQTTHGTSHNLWDKTGSNLERHSWFQQEADPSLQVAILTSFSRSLTTQNSYCEMQLFPHKHSHKPPKPTAILKTEISVNSPVREFYLYI